MDDKGYVIPLSSIISFVFRDGTVPRIPFYWLFVYVRYNLPLSTVLHFILFFFPLQIRSTKVTVLWTSDSKGLPPMKVKRR